MAHKGQTGTPMGGAVVRVGVKCKHQWSPWARAGILDPTERRDCKKCKRIQTRKPRKPST
jgi:hypothetical protein